jgi:uncharacterized protein (TIGR02186 family)
MVLLYCVPLGAQPRAQELVADLSKHFVAITTGFVGTEVLLFGATEGRGDVVIVVKGPARSEVVRRKGRIAGIWVNNGKLTFRDVPAFYGVAASKPIGDLMTESARRRHGIGIESLNLKPVRPVGAQELAGYRKGFIRNKIGDGLFSMQPAKVAFLGQRLFRSKMYFPANVPTGTYTVQVFLVRDGQVVSAQTTPLTIAKVGIGADVYNFAHSSSVFYGIIAIVIALLAGLFAGVVFRKA